MDSQKKQFSGKDVVFVYITNESSPPKTWEIMKKNIKGEHFYVNEKLWNQLCSKCDFEYIPNILIFDKNNNLYKQIRGYSKEDQTVINSINDQM